MSNSIFDKYLNSIDASTLEIEIAPLTSFGYILEIVQSSDYDAGVDDAQQTLFNLIRDVWDIAYSYGEHNALADSNVSLADMED